MPDTNLVPPYAETQKRDRQSRVSIPKDADKVVEVPSTRDAISDASAFMHNLSFAPSMKERRGSRNSFSTSLPIPRSPRVSRLSSAHKPSAVRRDILAGQIQDLNKDKVEAVKNMAFAFDIDGVLVHGNNPIQEGKDALKILNGDNELGMQFLSPIDHNGNR